MAGHDVAVCGNPDVERTAFSGGGEAIFSFPGGIVIALRDLQSLDVRIEFDGGEVRTFTFNADFVDEEEVLFSNADFLCEDLECPAGSHGAIVPPRDEDDVFRCGCVPDAPPPGDPNDMPNDMAAFLGAADEEEFVSDRAAGATVKDVLPSCGCHALDYLLA